MLLATANNHSNRNFLRFNENHTRTEYVYLVFEIHLINKQQKENSQETYKNTIVISK